MGVGNLKIGNYNNENYSGVSGVGGNRSYQTTVN